MAKYQTEFELSVSIGMEKKGKTASAIIAFPDSKDDAYLSIQVYSPAAKSRKGVFEDRATISGKSLETMAVNILRAIKSSKLKK